MSDPQQTMDANSLNAHAASLLERRDFGDWTEADETALETWLAQSQAHRAAYWRLEAAWGHTQRLVALNRPIAEKAVAPRAIWPNLIKIAATLAITVAFGTAAAFFFSGPRDKTFATAVGGHETIKFADGTKIELNTDTVLRTRMTTGQRTVWLDKGEAYFEVKHDAAHPFIVFAGDHRVTDLGTKFVIHRAAERLEVSLLEGRAQLAMADTHKRGPQAMLLPGDVAVGTSSAISVTRKPATELSRELGWRQGVLVFKHTTLADAVAEFNRYNREKLVIADPQSAQMTIGGTFKARHVEDFTRLVQLVLGLHVEAGGDEIVISR